MSAELLDGPVCWLYYAVGRDGDGEDDGDAPRAPAGSLSAGLPVPDEPVPVRERALALARSDPGAARRRLAGGEWIADALWEAWGPVLEAAGAERALVVQAAAEYRLELWLWVVGERIWSQCAEGLAGRVARRVAVGG